MCRPSGCFHMEGLVYADDKDGNMQLYSSTVSQGGGGSSQYMQSGVQHRRKETKWD